MWLSPMAVKIFMTSVSLQVYLLVVLRGLVCVCQQFCWGTCLCAILISWPVDLLPWTLEVTIVSQAHVRLLRRKGNHWKRCCTSWCTHHAWLNCLWLWVNIKMTRIVAVDNIPMNAQSQRGIRTGLCGRRIPSLGRTGSFFSSEIFLGKPLFPSFCLPIVVSYTSPVNNNSAAELAEH
jgi:hypothetical protein